MLLSNKQKGLKISTLSSQKLEQLTTKIHRKILTAIKALSCGANASTISGISDAISPARHVQIKKWRARSVQLSSYICTREVAKHERSARVAPGDRRVRL